MTQLMHCIIVIWITRIIRNTTMQKQTNTQQ